MKLATTIAPLFVFSFASFAALAGCAAAVDDASTSDEAEIVEDDLVSASVNSGYFQVTRRDVRKCAAPFCGGYFVKRVNEATTLCANGTRQAECYVASVELGSLGFSVREEADARAYMESGRVLVKARTYKKHVGKSVLGTLKANEVWLGATGSAPEGTFFRAADNGLRCIKAPCPAVTAFTLNSKENHNVIDVVLDQTDTKAEQVTLDAAARAIGTKEGVLVAGGLLLPKCLPGSDCGPKVIASEFYLRFAHREGEACGVWALSACNVGQYCAWAPGDMCGAADAPGTCAYPSNMFCPQVYQPVCGCDGKTHGNACMAASAGTSISSDGPCVDDEAPPTMN